MNPNREELLFQLALEKPATERDSFLKAVCGDDAALRARIEALLAAHEQTEGALAESAMAVKATMKIEFTDAPDETVGQKIGRYKILEKVGEGGCGVVYVAEQTEPVRRRVALKVIKLGMDTKQVVARFEAERQALAMMDHPNIAKVLDAGTTESPVAAGILPAVEPGFQPGGAGVAISNAPESSKPSPGDQRPPATAGRMPAATLSAGRPYFVMELVRGIRITDYCDQNNLSTRERLDLFIKICQAIQHAHQKGIIHRDIKPSNILVTLHDGVPVPKVIDFGIAKATEGRLTDATVYTQLHQFIGTPAYMSPEQAEMSGLDVDTRSDIYSLGVLLYELLTGKTPFDGQELMSLGLDAMRKTIREKEPLRPSTKLHTLPGEDLTTTAKRHGVDVPRLVSQLRGDLDWIVMKCLEKDRTRRYDTANGLAFDLKRHLSNEPVLARPPSAAYKFQKAFRRNKLAFTAGLAVAAALLLGIIATTLQSVRATRAKAQEIVQRNKAEANEQKAVAAQASETKLREQAQADELAARQRAYASDMNVAMQALRGSNLGRALTLLNRQRPQPGQSDLRGWEWRYLWQQTRSDALFTLCQQSSEIESLAVSADGRWLAVGLAHKGGVLVYDLQTRQQVAQLAPGEGWVRAAFSPTGSLLAFTSMNFPADGKPQTTLHLWNTTTRQTVVEFPLDNLDCYCTGLAFSQDGRTLVTSTIGVNSGFITLWRVPEGTRLASYASEQLSIIPATDFAATSDLSIAAYGNGNGRIHVIDLRDGKELWTVTAAKEYITALAFSPDGKTLASAAGYNESDIRLWDTATGKETGKLVGHTSWVGSLVFWPDGKKLASASADQTIRIWDIASQKCLDVLRGHRQEVWRLALLPDNQTLASGCKDGTVCLWNTSVTHPHREKNTWPDKMLTWRFAPDSRSVLTLDQNGNVARWSGADFQEREPLLVIGTNLYQDVRFYRFSLNGRFLAAGSTNGNMFVWDLSRRALWQTFKPGDRNAAPQTFLAGGNHHREGNPFFGRVAPLAFLAGGNRLVGWSGDDNLCFEWDLEANREIQSWVAVPNVQYGGLSPDERLVVEVGGEGDIAARNLTGHGSTNLPLDAVEGFGVAFSPDGKRLAIASELGYARVWDTATWHEAATLRGFLNAVFSVAFSPDGKRLIAGGSNPNDTVRLWDTDSWQELLTLEGSGSYVGISAFSPDGNAIGTTSGDGILQVWRAPSWAEINAAEAKENAAAQPTMKP
jgi:WD40 repeat protein/serine/threonine protein kinase